MSRPDVTLVLQRLSQHVAVPREAHWDLALFLLHYLKLAPSTSLFISSSTDLCLTAYCDADSASCSKTHRSLIRYCYLLGYTLVSWKTKKQATISRFSVEVEYQSLASTICEILWISYIYIYIYIYIYTS